MSQIIKLIASSIILNCLYAPASFSQESIQKDQSQQETTIQDEFKKKIIDGYEDKSQDFFIFMSVIKLAIKNNGINKINSSIEYPIKVDINGKQKKIISSRQMSRLFHKVFTDDYRNQVLNDFSDLHLLSQGVMLGRGSMWANIDQENSNWKIITINN